MARRKWRKDMVRMKWRKGYGEEETEERKERKEMEK